MYLFFWFNFLDQNKKKGRVKLYYGILDFLRL